MKAILAATALALAWPAMSQTQASWTIASNSEGFGLILAPKGGPAILSLACVRGTNQVLAIAYGVKPVAGQQELALRFDQRRVVFVVKPQALKDGKMVEASAKAGPALLNFIRTAKSISEEYAGARLGPFPAPPPELSKAFAERCGPLI